MQVLLPGHDWSQELCEQGFDVTWHLPSSSEFGLLLSLARARGRVKSREQLIEEVRDREYEVFDRSIDMHISHLRKKLEQDAKPLIKTVRGVGYQFCSTSDEETAA